MTVLESKRLTHMEDKLNELDSKLDEQAGKVDQILSALRGNDLDVNKGLIADHKNLRERVAKLETLKNRVIWISIGAGFSLGTIVEWILKVIKR